MRNLGKTCNGKGSWWHFNHMRPRWEVKHLRQLRINRCAMSQHILQNRNRGSFLKPHQAHCLLLCVKKSASFYCYGRSFNIQLLKNLSNNYMLTSTRKWVYLESPQYYARISMLSLHAVYVPLRLGFFRKLDYFELPSGKYASRQNIELATKISIKHLPRANKHHLRTTTIARRVGTVND